MTRAILLTLALAGCASRYTPIWNEYGPHGYAYEQLGPGSCLQAKPPQACIDAWRRNGVYR